MIANKKGADRNKFLQSIRFCWECNAKNIGQKDWVTYFSFNLGIAEQSVTEWNLNFSSDYARWTDELKSVASSGGYCPP